jgi:hypothetical protein
LFVIVFSTNTGIAGYVFASRTFPRLIRESRFRTCFVNTPEERKLARSFLHQLQEYVFSVFGDGNEALQINHEFATIQVCCCLPPHAPQQGGPWADELALDHQPVLNRGVENGDFQHRFVLTRDESKVQTKITDP